MIDLGYVVKGQGQPQHSAYISSELKLTCKFMIIMMGGVTELCSQR